MQYTDVESRKSLKDVFGHLRIDQTSLSSQAISSQINSLEAEGFCFHDNKEHQRSGWEVMYEKLLQEGVRSNRLSKMWVRNHYRMIVWKLSRYDAW